MQSPQFPDRKLSPISEYALILGAGAGAAASIAAQQLAAASIPVTTLVALGMLNRYRLDQRLKEGEPTGPSVSETTSRPHPAKSHGVSSQPVPESGRRNPGNMSSHSRPMSPVATLATAQFSRYRDPQDELNALQKGSLQQIGAQLKQVRQEKGLSLEAIYEQTFIQVYNLKAIEDGNLRCLPEPFYIRAFIQKYANTLGLNGTQLMAEFPG